MAVRLSRGHYVCEFQQGGIRVFRRLPQGCTQRQAQELETKLRREIFDRNTLGRKDELTLPGAIGLWLQSNRRKNQRQAESEARQWEPFVEGRLLREAPDVAEAAARNWATDAYTPTTAKRVGKHGRGLPQSSTVNRRLALLKAVCKHAWKQGLHPENLSGRISLLREDNKREVYLTKAEVMRLARHAPSTKSRSAILIAAYTGLRASELLALPSVSRSRAVTLHVATSKTGKPRNVPVPSPALAPLQELPLGLSYWQLHSEFSAARKAAGLEHVQFHDLRHTAASWLINAGVDLYTVGKILGHTTPATTARYAHLSTQTLAKAMARLK